MVFIHAPVRKDQNVRPFSVAAVHLHIQPLNGALQLSVFIVGDRHHGNLEAFHLHALDFQQVGVGEDRIVYLQDIAVLRLFLQHIPFRADVNSGGGHNMLPDSVDGRICNLREKLFKGMKQRMVCFAQEGQRRIHTHGRRGFRTVFRHGKDAGLQFVIGIAECLLQAGSFFRRIFLHALVRDLQVFQLHQVAVQPFSIGLTGGIGFLQMIVVDHLSFHRIHQKHLARMQSLLQADSGGIDVQNADL